MAHVSFAGSLPFCGSFLRQQPEPLRPAETSAIYISIQNIHFTLVRGQVRNEMCEGYSTLAWHVASLPAWLLLEPTSGILTNDYT